MEERKRIVYVKADRNTEVTNPVVTVGDVLKIECMDKKMLDRINGIILWDFQERADEKTKDRVAISILKVIACIHEIYPEIEVENLGEADFIVTFEAQKTTGGLEHILKAVCVVLISFTGAAFSIMTFNNDVDVKRVFSQIYELTTGMKSDGFTVIELFYSIGIVIGILIFFNHFGKKRFTVDPTPIEVEMRLYENDLQTTLIEDYSRKEKELDVGR